MIRKIKILLYRIFFKCKKCYWSCSFKYSDCYECDFLSWDDAYDENEGEYI